MQNRKNGPARQVVGKSRHRKNVQARGEERRGQLIDAARELLKEIPVEELTFGQIAAKAGVPEGSAYHFYANKYDVLSSLAKELSVQFVESYKEPIDETTIRSWQDLADLVVDRTAAIYAVDLAAVQIFLSGRTPPEVGMVDRSSVRTVSAVLVDLFDRLFVLPDVPNIHNVFYYFVELTDLMLSLSVMENGEITSEFLEESKRAGKGYLGTYLPPILTRRQVDVD
jgi:AcrR family transcriptional regulator